MTQLRPHATHAARALRYPLVLSSQRDADLLRQRDELQPDRHRRMGAQLQVHQLHRLLRRPASERVRAVRDSSQAVYEYRRHQQLPAPAQGSRRLHSRASRRRRGGQGRVPVLRRRDRSSCANNSVWKSAFPRPICGGWSTTRSRRRGSRDRAGIASVPECAGQGRQLRPASRSLRQPRRTPRHPDGLWRLGPYDILHLQRSRLQQARRRNRRGARSQNHEAHSLPGRCTGSMRDAARHDRRSA